MIRPINKKTLDWHLLPIEETITHLNSAAEGLSTTESSRRLSEFGPNELQKADRISPWQILLDQFKNVLVLILLIATGLSLFLGHGVESMVIAVIVLFAVLLGFVQEYRAERAIEALRQMAAPTARVIRDGAEMEVPARELVPGDVIMLRAGDRVPADARLSEAVNLQIEEAALTGESIPVEKHTTPLEGEDPATGRTWHMQALQRPTAVDGRSSWLPGCRLSSEKSPSSFRPWRPGRRLCSRTWTGSAISWPAPP